MTCFLIDKLPAPRNTDRFYDHNYGRSYECARTAYYSGFLYCSFGRPYACVVTADACTVVSAKIDGSQPWRRSVADSVIYTDWRRDNYWRAVGSLIGRSKRVGIEADHLTVSSRSTMEQMLGSRDIIDIAPSTMKARMIKSEEEIAMIREGARIADHGGEAIRNAIKVGAREIDIAMAGRDAMELEIARLVMDILSVC